MSFVGRDKQIALLQALFGSDGSSPVPSIFVYGVSGTGKTAVMKALAKSVASHHAFIDCVESYSPKLLFEHTLNQLSGTVPAEENGFKGYCRCEHISEFIRHLPVVMDRVKAPVAYVIIDHAERLRDMHPSILPAFLRLFELTQRRISVVIISNLVWDKFHGGTGVREPFLVHFPAYTKDVAAQILAAECPSDTDKAFYGQYVSMICNVFHLLCRDLVELRHIGALLFPCYCEPVKSGRLLASNTTLLYKAIEPLLRFQLKRLYLRTTSTTEWLQQREAGTAPTISRQLDLPLHSQYLLIAAYLASYNPARTDSQLFSKHDTGRRKAKRKRAQTEATPRALLGPASFPLERLLAIFYCILDARVEATAQIHVQIKSLVTIGLLQQGGASDHLDSVKYKCLLPYSDVAALAKLVDFDLAAYLNDS